MKKLTGIRTSLFAFVLGVFPAYTFASPTGEPSPEPTDVVVAMASRETTPSPKRPLKPLDTKPSPLPSTRPMDRNPGSLPPIPVPDRPKPEAPEPSASEPADSTSVH